MTPTAPHPTRDDGKGLVLRRRGRHAAACRRTVATVLDRAGADLAAELLSRSSRELTRIHYIEPDEHVNPVTAEILESLVPRRSADSGDGQWLRSIVGRDA